MTVETVEVALGARAYEVRIGAGLLDRAGAEIAPLLRRPRVVIVTDATVAALHLPRLQAGSRQRASRMTRSCCRRARGPRAGRSSPPAPRGFWSGRWSGAMSSWPSAAA